MPITSSFAPDEALQGENLPCHLIWEDIEFDHIRVTHPPIIKPLEIYNVPEGKWKDDGGTTYVEEVEVDGYLGMLFTSVMTEKTQETVNMQFSLCNKDGSVTAHVEKSIYLFRAELSVGEPKTEIRVDLPSRHTTGRTKIANAGQGTLLVEFATTKESELQKTLPDSIRAIREGFWENLKNELESVNHRFPKYEQNVQAFLQFAKAYALASSDVSFEDYAERAQKLSEQSRGDQEFQDALLDAFVKAILRSRQLVTIVDGTLEYYSAIQGRRIVLSDPAEVLELSERPKRLELEIRTYDSLAKRLKTVRLPPILVSARIGSTGKKLKSLVKEQYMLPIHRLFEW